jgi:glycosyltransferase involved in cell wall biosynthesis
METLLGQTCTEFEILLVDDGSTDGSSAMCDAYAAEHSAMVRVVHKKNGGLSSARNAGIDAARENTSFSLTPMTG